MQAGYQNFRIIIGISVGDRENRKLKPEGIIPDFEPIMENLRKL
jgi:hypothetical protein